MNFQVLLSCPIPKPHQEKIPESVSIVESECEKASNNLRVLYDRPSEMGLKERVHLKSDRFFGSQAKIHKKIYFQQGKKYLITSDLT